MSGADKEKNGGKEPVKRESQKEMGRAVAEGSGGGNHSKESSPRASVMRSAVDWAEVKHTPFIFSEQTERRN